MGIANPSESIIDRLTKDGVKCLYLLLGDDQAEFPKLLKLPKEIEFIVVQTSYLSPVTSKAHLVLPSPTWTEASEKYSTLDGITKSTSRLIKPPDSIKTNAEILNEISKQLRK